MPETSNWSEKVSAQLERLLCSTEFKKSKRLRKFLSYVVSQTLAGADTIRSYNIAVEVFDKGEGFDPNDPYVRNIARHARKALKNYYDTAGLGDDIRIDVPAGNYVATFAQRAVTAGKGADLLIREAPSNTPPYQVHTLPDTALPHPRHPGYSPADNSIPTIAVIPFRIIGPAYSNEAVVGDMIADRTIASLAQSPQFNVISRLSTAKFKCEKWTLKAISEQLGSHFVMSGSYRCKKGTLFLSVEFADANTGEVIWADELSCLLEDLICESDDIVDELIGQTFRSIIVHEIKRASFEPLESLALHTKLIVAVHNMHSTSERRFHQAKEHFEHILGLYPRHTTVNAQMAHWHVLRLNRSGGWDESVERNKEQAVRFVNRALDEDPYHPLALTISGLVETQFNREPEKGLSIYNFAQQYHPNNPLLCTYKAAVLSYKGEGAKAVECAKRALKLSPFDPQINMFHTCAAAAYYSINDFDNAEKHANRADELNPEHTSNLRTLVAIQVDLGKIAEARRSAQRLLQNDPQFTTSSYLARSPNAAYHSGRMIAKRLEQAGVPSK